MTDHEFAFRLVTEVLQDVVADVVMPSFRSLRPEDIHAKETPGDPDDLVTIVDKAAEKYLVERLEGIISGATFVGEEAVCENPALLAALAGDAPAWLIDPIDGTKNFAKGDRNFGIMLALVERGATRASWMAVPAATGGRYIVAAQSGGGTRINGDRVSSTRPRASRPRGTVHARMAPPDTARTMLASLQDRYDLLPSTGSAATEYSEIIRGSKDFVIYYRLLPWDHAPGALAVVESGGVALHLDGAPYTPLSPNQVTVFAATPEIGEMIVRWLR